MIDKQMTTVTIIIINHNYGRFLGEAIDSALKQDTKPIQIIVVDDGSTDNSHDVIAGFGSVITAMLKENGGQVSAVNAGFSRAVGDLCIFLDADDILYPSCVEEVVKAWQPGDGKIQYRLDTIDSAGQDQHMPFPYFKKSLTAEAIRRQSFESGWYPWPVSSGNAFSRTFLEKLLPIDDKIIYRSPDGYLNKLAPLFGHVVSLNHVLGAYRVHGENAWARSGEGWTADVAIRWLAFNKVLVTAFLETAKANGINIKVPLQPPLQEIEYRLLAARFAPTASPYASDTRSSLLRAGCKSVFSTPNLSPITRALWLIWITALVCSPLFLLRTLIRKFRGQTGRANISRAVTWVSRF